MKPLLTTLLLLVTPIFAQAALTTAQQVSCAQASIATILGESFRIDPTSIDLGLTAMEKFNPGVILGRAMGADARDFNVSFRGVDRSGRKMKGEIIVRTGPHPSHYSSRNNSTIALQDFAGKLFECSAAKSQILDPDSTPASRNVTPADFKFYLLK